MKVAKVIPIFKNGDKHRLNNYRPVSLLSLFSKILEKWFTQKVTVFLEKHKLISDNQYGFREQRSTSLALIQLIENITAATDRYEFTI